MPLPAAIPAAVAVGTGLANLIGGERANAANAKQAREQMKFQERMSSTAVQRAVEDYRKAGLNPALAYGQGGASTPSGAAAKMEDTIGRGASSGLAARQAMTDLQNAQATTKLLAAQEEKTRVEGIEVASRDQANRLEMGRKEAIFDYEIAQMIAQTENLKAAAGSSSASATEAAARTALTKLQTELQRLDFPEKEAMAKMWRSGMGQSVLPWMNSARGAASMIPVVGKLFSRGKK